MKAEWKVKLIQKFLKRDDYICFFSMNGEHTKKTGCICKADKDTIKLVAYRTMEQNPETREFLLEVVKEYCKRYEVNGRNFAKDILTK